MIIIAHRGNLNGENKDWENHPNYIQKAIDNKFQVEIDLRVIKGVLWLGHDIPQYEVSMEWLYQKRNDLWIHTKNFEALALLAKKKDEFKYFWHTCDSFVITSTHQIWAHDLNELNDPSNSIVPLLDHESLNSKFKSAYYAICTDYSNLCKKKLNGH